jgi:hypothetical protein
MGMEATQKATAQRIIEILEAKGRPFFPDEIEKAIDQHDLRVEGDPNHLVQEVLAEGTRRGVEVLKNFSDAFQVPLPLLEAEKVLQEGGVAFLERDGSRMKEPSLKVEFRKAEGSQLGRVIKTLHLPLHGPELPGDAELYVWPGLPYLRLGHSLRAVRGRAFFMGYSEKEIEKTAENIRTLAPFLPAMDLDGLVEAFGSLMELKKSEAKVEGPHILVRGVDFWALRRGPILGDPEVDTALLAEREVSLSFPGDVEIVLGVRWYWEWDGVGFHDLRIRWGEEVADFNEGADDGDGMLATPLDMNPVAEAVKNRLRREIYFFETEGWSLVLGNLSPRMLALVRVLAEQEDPLAFLAEGKLAPYVTAELFRDL